MTEKLVPTVNTRVTMLEFARALLAVWPEALKAQAGILWAHFAGETGDARYCWNYNLGNVKHIKGDGYDYVSLAGVWEGFRIGDEDKDGDIDADDRELLVSRLVASGLWKRDPSESHAAAVGPGKVSLIATTAHQTTWFRAYPSLQTGMRSFVDMKRAPTSRYFSAWAHVLTPNARAYAYALADRGYYTASPVVYTQVLEAKLAKWMASDAFEQAGGTLGPSPTTPPSREVVTPRDVQQALELLRYEVGAIDGIVGPLTKNAVRDFQAARGLVVDGIPGPKTRAALTAVLRERGLYLPKVHP